MLLENRQESFAVRGLQQVGHFMDDDVFQQVFRLLHQFGVEADVTGAVIAAAPPGLHALQVVAGDANRQFRFPFLDQVRHNRVQQGLVPFVENFGPLPGIAAGTHGEGNALVVECDGGLAVAVSDG